MSGGILTFNIQKSSILPHFREGLPHFREATTNKYLHFKWIPIGYEVNNNSYAYDLFQSFSLQSAAGSRESSISKQKNEKQQMTNNDSFSLMTQPK